MGLKLINISKGAIGIQLQQWIYRQSHIRRYSWQMCLSSWRNLSGCDETTSLIAALYMPNGLMIRILFQYTSPCQQPSLKQLVFLLTTFSFNSGLGVSARSQQGFTVGRRTARLDAPNIVTKLWLPRMRKLALADHQSVNMHI